MKVDDKMVEHLDQLWRLEFDEATKEKKKVDFEKMLEPVTKLEKVDTEGVDPLVYMSRETNVLREDKVKGMVSQKEALQNAPKKDTDYIRIPKVIKK